MYNELDSENTDKDLVSRLKKDINKNLGELIEEFNLDYNTIRTRYHVKFLYEAEHRIVGYESRMYYKAYKSLFNSLMDQLDSHNWE
jgi:hypothetical protein